jgi:hypothetical protein
MVRVAVESGGSWGRMNPTFGFIYRDGEPDREQPVVAEAQPQFPRPAPWASQPWPAQTRVEPVVAQAQPQTATPPAVQAQAAQPQPVQPQPQAVQAEAVQAQAAQPQPVQPQPQAIQPQPRFQLAAVETEAADDQDEPKSTRHHATPTPRAPEKAKADTPASRKELAAKAKRDHQQELADAKAAKAKPDRHEKLAAKADHGKAEQQKLAKADHAKAEHEKLAASKADHEKAHQDKLAKTEQAKQEKMAAAKAEHDKAREQKLAKAEQKKTEHEKLAKAEHNPAKRHTDTKTAAAHDRPARRTHVARNDQLAGEGTNMEQLAQARAGE